MRALLICMTHSGEREREKAESGKVGNEGRKEEKKRNAKTRRQGGGWPRRPGTRNCLLQRDCKMRRESARETTL